jgi:hypothetical protein
VRVRVREAAALPAGVEYALVLMHADEWSEVGSARGTSVLDLSLPRSGDFELAWSLRSVATGLEARLWDEEEPQIIHVDDSTLVQAFDATLDPNLVTETLERLLGTGGR